MDVPLGDGNGLEAAQTLLAQLRLAPTLRLPLAPDPDAHRGALMDALPAARILSMIEKELYFLRGSHKAPLVPPSADAAPFHSLWNEQQAVKLIVKAVRASPAPPDATAPFLAVVSAYCEATLFPTATRAFSASCTTFPTAPVGVHNVGVADGGPDVGQCLVLARPVAPFTPLLTIPVAELWCQDTIVQHSPIGRALFTDASLQEIIGGSEETALIIAFVHELAVVGAAASHWRLLLDGLPKDFDSQPMFWPFGDLMYLEATNLLDETIAKRDGIRQFCEQITMHIIPELQSRGVETSAAAFSEENVMYARAVFDSRAFSLNFGGDVRMALAPIADMTNHSERSHIMSRRIEGTAAGATFVMQSFGAVSCVGHEVVMSYGPLQNWELLLQYGFVLDANPYDALPVPVAIQAEAEDDAVALERQAALVAWGLDGDHFLPESGIPPPALLAALRVAVCHAPLVSQVALDIYTPIPAVEPYVVDLLRRSLEGVAASFSSTLADDEELLRRDAEVQALARGATNGEDCPQEEEWEEEEDVPLSSNARLAVRFRVGLKRILGKGLAWCDAAQALLPLPVA